VILDRGIAFTLRGHTLSQAVNTTALITHWSMEGARRDLDVRFGSAVDILATVSEQSRESTDDEASEAPSAPSRPLMVKQAGDDDWEPLVVGT
jgi:hypothetical protein